MNIDGDWDDEGEHFLLDVPVAPGLGSTPLDSLTIPVDAVTGTTFVRVRISTQSELSASGLAPDGEVEDFAIEITAATCSLVVTTASDTVDAGDGLTSLREAINCAT